MGRILWSACACVAIVAAAEARTWTDKSGRFQLEAELVKVEDAKAHLKGSDGQVVVVPVEKLSDADRAFIEKAQKGQPAASDAKGAEPPSGKEAKTAGGSPAKHSTRPRKAKTPARKGRFQTSFAEHSPLSESKRILARMLSPKAETWPTAKPDGSPLPDHFYKIADEVFQVYVPEDYRGTVDFGLMVYIGSDDKGRR